MAAPAGRGRIRDMPPDARYVPTAAAAQLAGVNVRTVRRWASSGRVPAMSRAHRILVDLDAVRRLAAEGTPDGDMSGAIPDDPGHAPDSRDTTALIEFFRERDQLVERLHREVYELSGRVGWLQSELEQARQTIKQLSAPAGNEGAIFAPSNDQPPAETTVTTVTPVSAPVRAAETPLRVSWWRRWLGLTGQTT